MGERSGNTKSAQARSRHMELWLRSPLQNATALMPLRKRTVELEKPSKEHQHVNKLIARKILGYLFVGSVCWKRKQICFPTICIEKELQRGSVDLGSFICSQIPLRSFNLQKPSANCTESSMSQQQNF